MYSVKEVFLKNSQNSQGNTCARTSFLHVRVHIRGLLYAERLAMLLKKRLWHRCFHVNFVNFLREPFLQNTSDGCFWQNRHAQYPSETFFSIFIVHLNISSQLCSASFVKFSCFSQLFWHAFLDYFSNIHFYHLYSTNLVPQFQEASLIPENCFQLSYLH